jgi:hypothetical protein
MTTLVLPKERAVQTEIQRLANLGSKTAAQIWQARKTSYDPENFYHGGYPGLEAGGYLQPADATGYVSFRRVIAEMHIPGILPHRPGDHSYVYLTHNVQLAREHAAGWSNWHCIATGEREAGRVYKVIPMSLVIPDCQYPCCCLTGHDLAVECCAKVKSAMVSYVYEDVWPIQSAGWDKFLVVMGDIYGQWKKVNAMRIETAGAA